MDGVKVEIIGDLRTREPGGKWSEIGDLSKGMQEGAPRGQDEGSREAL